MIYDFSCSETVGLLHKIIPAFGNAVAVLIMLAGMSALGAAAQGRKDFRPTDIFCGWGLTAAGMTLTAVLFTHALLGTATGVGLCMLAAMLRVAPRGYFKAPFWLLSLFPGLFILTAANLTGIAGWDDFSHWVPNALYAYHVNGVPGLANPAPHSAWPSYPYAIPFATYLASQLAGGFLMQGGVMFTFLLILAFADMLARLFPPPANRQALFGRTALALLILTLANPSFNASFTMTNEGDTSTMIVIGALGILLWQMIEALAAKNKTRELTVQIALTATAFILIKQVDFIILGLLVFAFLVAACKNNVLKAALKNLPCMLAPAIILHMIWQHDAATQMSTAGFGITPWASWRWDLTVPLLKAMLHEIVQKNGLFGLVFCTLIAGTVSLLRPATPLRTLALMTAIVAGGYIAFLFTAYIGSSFSEYEIRKAAAFYRYATHIGYLETALVWITLPALWNKWAKKENRPPLPPCFTTPTAHAAAILFLVSALPLAMLAHSYWLIRESGPQTCAIRATGAQLARLLPDGTRLAVVEPQRDVFPDFVINFELALEEARSGTSSIVTKHISALDLPSFADLQRQLNMDDTADAVLIEPGSYDKDFPDAKPVLLLRQGQNWQQKSF